MSEAARRACKQGAGGFLALSIAMCLAPHSQAQAQAEVPTAYLWGVRRGCHLDPLAADAALSRIRGVGRRVVALNTPATAEFRSCSEQSCAEMVMRTAGCAGTRGPVIGAEVDEVTVGNAIATRIRAWRYELGASEAAPAAHEYAVCLGDACSAMHIEDMIARALNRLLDRAFTAPEAPAQASLPFPAAECVRAAELGSGLPPFCEQPMPAGICGTTEMAMEPSGRAPISRVLLDLPHPSPRPRGWEWLPIISTGVGILATVGLGVANDRVTIQTADQTVSHVLTPTFWTSAAFTVILGASSIGIVGDRYNRERRAFHHPESSAAAGCPLLVDGFDLGKSQ